MGLYEQITVAHEQNGDNAPSLGLKSGKSDHDGSVASREFVDENGAEKIKVSQTSHARAGGERHQVFFSSKIDDNLNTPTRASDKLDVFSVTMKGPVPGDCKTCRAAAEWEHMGPGLWCFHRALFLGKSGKPTSCDEAKLNCPLKDSNSDQI